MSSGDKLFEDKLFEENESCEGVQVLMWTRFQELIKLRSNQTALVLFRNIFICDLKLHPWKNTSQFL